MKRVLVAAIGVIAASAAFAQYTGAGSTSPYKPIPYKPPSTPQYYYQQAPSRPAPMPYTMGNADRSMGAMGFAPNVRLYTNPPAPVPFPAHAFGQAAIYGGKCVLQAKGAADWVPGGWKYPAAAVGCFLGP